MEDNSQMEAETLESRSGKKGWGKVPKKVHKAERERMKREHFNDLFLELANSLDLSEQQSGKASVLTDATRMIKDMISQIESLRKENLALTCEAKDVTLEKKELQDETSALESHISELQIEIEKKRINEEPQIDLNHTAPPGVYQDPLFQNSKAFYVIPYCPSGPPPHPGVYQDPSVSLFQNPNNNHNQESVVVCKPQPRYVSPGDASWPSQILEK